MRTLFKTVKVLQEETGKEFCLDYYILAKEVEVEGTRVNRFGMEICKRDVRDDGTPYLEYRKIFDILHTEREAIELLELMARNSVTPISMKEVLEDVLGNLDFSTEEVYVEVAS